jgi:hypothetical protein
VPLGLDCWVDAGWRTDPTYRHELRYWNGVEWTEHVSDRGVQATDAYATPASSNAVVSPEANTKVAAWHPDPTGRAQFRYWDAERWTQWVADGGVEKLDPEPAPDYPPPPSAPVPGGPPPPSGAPTPAAAPASLPFRSIRGLAVALYCLLGVALALAVGTAFALANQVVKLNRLDDRSTFQRYVNWRDAHDTVSTVGGWLFIIGLAAFVVFVVFLFRASKNTELWQTERARWTPGWTIGAWFIPAANVVIPLLVILEVWKRSPEDRVSARRPHGAIVIVCWIALVLGLLAVSTGMGADDSYTISDSRTLTIIGIVGATVLVVSLLMQIVIVKRLSDRQRNLEEAELQRA